MASSGGLPSLTLAITWVTWFTLPEAVRGECGINKRGDQVIKLDTRTTVKCR